jgi:transcription elongation factor Elf1
VEEFAKVQCPFCGQRFEVEVDPTEARQVFTTDCEVCCRPFELRVECRAGSVVSVEVAPE